MAYQESAGPARPDQEEEEEKLRCTLNLLVEREGQRRTAEILGVDRKTVALALQRDALTPRMRNAIERVMLRNPERELGETSPDIVSEALKTLNSTVDDLVDEVKGLARRVEALEQGQSDGDQVSVSVAVVLDQGQDPPVPSPMVVEHRQVPSLPEVRPLPWWRRLVRALGAGP